MNATDGANGDETSRRWGRVVTAALAVVVAVIVMSPVCRFRLDMGAGFRGIEFLGAFCMVGVALDTPGVPPLVLNVPRHAVAEAQLRPGTAVSVCLPPAALRILS